MKKRRERRGDYKGKYFLPKKEESLKKTMMMMTGTVV
jgi:hypothetical protein